ncbi:GTP cyclohydrolase I FolE [Mobiluncus mulieris]|uniref:GTP cyclohydrolase 1 n=2 Tax=Mobiluncus mulieris TaxID=2052 RepID=E0QTS4_9ACTO|nr:GTP cyclohydrolase I FolE [Mobiluncus mulieris]EEJ53387.1 GTP cyclohydrolase I [Mobiluncus mulieris ATCC 35243]EEZ91252.1 GTP cyclohydrolase I [Mobiluncus mulieris 28-1]EFM45118.1 GTP cyclohydrolase I [Mobiluncus mulieris ATCC 35239]EFN92889.1 GTP cyclohydrolase I [Mobiluncus mulieris FB024-16]MBB5845312.1 GTP cyclohydrolase I [Mobiluncus mulieris]
MTVRKYDAAKVEQAVRDLLAAVGEDPQREGLIETPARLGRSFAELLEGYREDPKEHLRRLFPVDHNDLILVKDIPFNSTCEHHLLPFFGHAHVGYIPKGKRVTGLSKLARLVDGYAHRLQVQERLTEQISQALWEVLDPLGVIVVLQAEHMCMTVRGVKKPGARTTTSAVRGVMQSSQVTRSEAMSLILSRD